MPHRLATRWLRPVWAAVACLALAAPAGAQLLRPSAPLTLAGSRPAALGAPDRAAATPPDWTAKLDPSARLLALGVAPALVFGTDAGALRAPDGQPAVDVFVQTADPAALASIAGVEVRAVAGDVAVVRAPVAALEAIARRGATRRVEASHVRHALNDTGRADIRADAVHAGAGGLPRAFTGQGVVVGVVDSGLDVTHPDFFGPGGSRVQFLLEFLQSGGQTVYTKAQIDANPQAIPQRDGTGGNGHGTHVTGSAAGSGGLVPAMRGVAPAADLVFVKGVRHPDSQGGFSDADVVAGVDFIFQRAQQLGRPAVANLSLGGHFGPHDGTSLYEQALSNLGGAGRIVVAAAGNEGDNLVHAGDATTPGVVNETLWFSGSPQFAAASLWYDGGALNQFALSAYVVNGGQLQFLGQMVVNAGQVVGGTTGAPFVVQGQTIATVLLDAATTSAPGNADGNVLVQLHSAGGQDLRNIVWSIASVGNGSGRFDAWALAGSEFYGQVAGLPGNETPGDTQRTVGVPSTALGLVAVGSHVTNNDWVDIDGVPRQQTRPGPSGSPVVVTVGARSVFSSNGPTRDGRVGVDVTGPGELIFSPLSLAAVSTGGAGVTRDRILLGGGYHGLEGTSMASPHVAGTVALMLEADPGLTPAEVRQILRETARADGFTGGLPNTGFGYGKADALAAVLRTLALCGASCGGGGGGSSTFAEAEPNNAPAQAQSVGGGSPVTVNGVAEQSDAGTLTITYSPTDVDDLEDLFRITTTGTGLALQLGGFNRDLDLFLLNGAGTQIVASATTTSTTGTETISQPGLPAGTYLVGVSYYDGAGPGQSSYQLVATGAFAVDDADGPDADGLVFAPAFPNPARGEATLAFSLPSAADVRLAVYDVLGREVARVHDGPLAAGEHRLTLDAAPLGAGLYVARLTAGAAVRTQTLVVAR